MGRPKNERYSKNAFKSKGIGDSLSGQGFAQSRKKKCIKKYGKLVRKIAGDKMEEDKASDLSRQQIKTNELIAARKQYKLDKKAKEQKLKEIKEENQRHRDIVMKNIDKRKKVSKELSRRTKKGQPVMKTQIEHMLEKIKAKS